MSSLTFLKTENILNNQENTRFTLPKNLSVFLPARPIKKIAFSGGGAKGAAYPGAVMALEDNGMLSKISEDNPTEIRGGKIDTVGGSSAGAMIAMMVALGMNGKTIEKISNENSFHTLLEKSLAGLDSGKTLLNILRNIVVAQMKQMIEIADQLLQQHKT